MSRSSASEAAPGPKPAKSAAPPSRGQVEPFAALAAVLAVGLAISLYAGVLADAAPGASDRTVAETTLDRVARSASDGSVVVPDRIPEALAVTPDGYRVNVTLAAGGTTLRAGPTPPESADLTQPESADPTQPESADRATRRVSVRLAPGNVRPGRLTVVVWS